MKYPSLIERAVSAVSMLNGVGYKTALRHVLAMVQWDQEKLSNFVQSIKDLQKVNFCKQCGNFSEEVLCGICNDSKRIESKTICVVQGISDLIAIESSNNYFGLYHCLNGVLNPLMGVGPDDIRLKELFTSIEVNSVENVILAINPSVEGDATCSFIRQSIDEKVKVERIGFGVPMGGSLDHLDSLTISKALENRRDI